MSNPTHTLREKIQQLDALHRDGLISDARHAESRAELEAALVAEVMAAPAAAAPAATVSATAAAAATAATTAASPAARRPGNPRVWIGIGAFVLVAGGIGYAWKGSPTLDPSRTPVVNADGSAGGQPAAPHDLGNDQMLAMVQGLADRLKTEKGTAEQWGMLARSYATLGKHADAVKAYAKAVEMDPKDAVLMADYADSLAVEQGRLLAGKPMEWVKRALAVDPKQPKALLLAGTEAFGRKDYAAAMQHWEKVVKGGVASGSLLEQAQAGLADARQAAGLPPEAAPQPAKAGAGASVQGSVKLAPALAAKVKPDDTVFVVARPSEGARMPLAVLKRQVRDLPLTFTLDDSMAMSPQAKLSGATLVVVSARISRSGQAMPQPGDLEGQSSPMPVGSQGIQVEIRDTVK